MHGCCHVSSELFHILTLHNFDGSINLMRKEVDLPVKLFKEVLFLIFLFSFMSQESSEFKLVNLTRVMTSLKMTVQPSP